MKAKIFDPKKIIVYMSIFMITILAIRLIVVFYFTSRGINLEYPYNSMLFDPFHRFTDWLMPIEWSKLANPYDMTNELYNQIAATPYTILNFWIISIATVINPYLYFFILLFISIGLNYLIFVKIINLASPINTLHMFLAFMIGFYPIWFLIDRGNADVISLLFLSIAFYSLIYKKHTLITALAIAIVVSLKPSSALFALVFLFMKKRDAFIGFTLIFIVYMWPVIILGNSFDYFIPVIQKAMSQIGNQTTFCHNMLCAIRIFSEGTDSLKLIVPMVGVFILLISLLRLHMSKVKFKIEIALFQIIAISILINDPDPDYRLIFLLPVFLMSLGMLKDENIGALIIGNKIKKILFFLSFLVLFSFINIDIPNTIAYYTIIKVSAVIYLVYIYCFALLSQGKMKNGTV